MIRVVYEIISNLNIWQKALIIKIQPMGNANNPCENTKINEGFHLNNPNFV